MLAKHIGDPVSKDDILKISNASSNLVSIKQVRAYQELVPKDVENLLPQRQEEIERDKQQADTLISHALSDVVRLRCKVRK
mgnify:FL=1